MGVKLAPTCLHLSQPILPHSPTTSQTLASSISSPSSRRRRRGDGGAFLSCRYVHTLDRSALFGTQPTKLHRTQSCEIPKPKIRTIKRASSASLDPFFDEDFSEKIEDLARRFQLSAENDAAENHSESETSSDSRNNHDLDIADIYKRFSEESSDWTERDEMITANIERKANSVDLPLSLRIIKRKIKWHEGIIEAGESAYCSIKKAFSSMVFMIRELHSYTLQLRELLFYEDLQDILVRVQKEMHASFVWLFQQVFSHTPTLMVYVMILLANFTVHSMGHNTAIAASPPISSYSTATEISSVSELHDQKDKKFDSSTIKTFPVSSSSGKTTSVGGNNGGGGKFRKVASGTDGDGASNRSEVYPTIIPDGSPGSQLSSFGTTREAESVSEEDSREEVVLWNSIVKEAERMQAAELSDEVLDHETMGRLVSPVSAKIEDDDYAEYFRTELFYQMGLAQEPNNSLLLANYAQFLYLIAHDYDRAEQYFKKAIGVEPPDAEAYNKYATFLWRVRNDIWAAEETYLEAISAEPSNSYYAANYAHFLWNTGGEDTCFPLT